MVAIWKSEPMSKKVFDILFKRALDLYKTGINVMLCRPIFSRLPQNKNRFMVVVTVYYIAFSLHSKFKFVPRTANN